MAFRMILAVLAGLIFGNLSTGIVLGKLMGNVDIRTRGSGGAGATNMLRTLGWAPGLLTLLGDALKGVLAVLAGRWLGGVHGAMLAGIAVVMQHNWPVAFGFRGGKGVATSAAVMLMMDPVSGIAAFLLGILISGITRMVSVGSISCAILLFLYMLISRFGQWDWVLFAFVICGMVVFQHRENIRRIAAGKENKLDFEKLKWFNR